MYRISEFSKITGLTIKALRYYDEQSLLIPSCRDSETSYRFYDDNDFKRATLIKILRSLDFSIMEIRDILLNYECEEDLYYYLREKQNMIRRNIFTENERIEKMENFLRPLNKSPIRSADAEYKTIPAIRAISTMHAGTYENLNLACKSLYQYANNQSIQLATPSREIYIKGPGRIFRGNSEKYVTEVLIPY